MRFDKCGWLCILLNFPQQFAGVTFICEFLQLTVAQMMPAFAWVIYHESCGANLNFIYLSDGCWGFWDLAQIQTLQYNLHQFSTKEGLVTFEKTCFTLRFLSDINNSLCLLSSLMWVPSQGAPLFSPVRNLCVFVIPFPCFISLEQCAVTSTALILCSVDAQIHFLR